MSVTLHGAVIVLSVFGLPHIQRDFQIEDVPMVVDLVTISNETNLLSQYVPDPKPKKGLQIQPNPKKDASKPVAPSAPLPKAEAVVAPLPQPAVKAEPRPKTEPKPVLKPEVKPRAPKRLAKAKPTGSPSRRTNLPRF